MIPTGKENVSKAIKSIGQELIKRADKISEDLEKVSTITINAILTPQELVNFDVTKNYVAEFEE